MAQILKPGYQVQNYISSGQGVVGGGDANNGVLTQLNQGSTDSVDISNDKTGINKIWVTDGNDTINLNGGGWTQGGTVTDDTSGGILGIEYDNGAGGKVIIAGGAKVNIAAAPAPAPEPSPTPAAPTPEPSPAPTPAAPVDTTPKYDPAKVQAEVVKDIKKIELDNGANTDGLVNKTEIQKALDNNIFTGNKQTYWQNVLKQFDDLDIDLGADRHKDDMINAIDIGPSSGTSTSNAFKTSNYTYYQKNTAQWNATKSAYTGGDGGTQAASDTEVNGVFNLKNRNTASGGIVSNGWTALKNTFASLEKSGTDSKYVSISSLFSSLADGLLDANPLAKKAAVAIVNDSALANNLDTASVETDAKDGLFSGEDLGIMAKQATLDGNV